MMIRFKSNASGNVSEGDSGWNSYLRNVLLSTGEDILVEANPNDTTWGAGLNAKDPKIFDKDAWQGKNQLGDMLMSVRWDIMSDNRRHKQSTISIT